MAIERGYEAQVSAPAPVAPVQVSPEAFGAGIGRALTEIGDQAHQNELRAYEIDKQLTAQREHTQWAVQFADGTAQVAGQIADMEAKPANGGVGHVAAVQEQLGKLDPLMDGITDPQTRQAAQVQLAQWKAQQVARAHEFQTVQGLKDAHANFVDTIGSLQNRLSNSDGGENSFADAAKQVGWLIGGMPVGDAERGQLLREATGQLLIGRASALADRDPAALGKLIDSGGWDAALTPQQMASVRQLQTVGAQRAAAEQHQQEAAADAAQREAQRQVMDRYAAMKLMIDGHETIAAKDLAQLAADAKSAGVGLEDQTKIGLLSEEAGARSAMAGVSTRQLEDQYRGLSEKRDAGQLRDGADLRQIDRLGSELESRAKREGDSIGQLWHQGADGQAEALSQLAAMPIEQRARVAAQMGEDKLAVVAELPAPFQKTALEGARRRVADKGLAFLPQTKTRTGNIVLDEEGLRQAFRDTLGLSIYNQLGGAENLREAAVDYYVGSQARMGQQGGWRTDAFAKAVKVMFGATTRADGSWQGGLGTVRGRRVELPPRWNESEFDQRLSRYDFAGSGARYANGQPAQKADVLANYQLLLDHAAPDGTHFYKLVDHAGRPLIRSGGHVFWLPVPQGAR